MAEFLASLRQSSVSHDQPEIIKKILLYMLNQCSRLFENADKKNNVKFILNYSLIL